MKSSPPKPKLAYDMLISSREGQFFARLKKVELVEGVHQLRDVTLERTGTLCPELRSLDVSFCPSITGVGIGGIGKYCTKVTELRINGCSEVRSLGSDLEFSKLEVLVADSSGFEDKGLEMIGRGCQRLQMVDLEDCGRVTEKGIRELLKSCKVPTKELRDLLLRHGVLVIFG